jgi:hypothetical protein
MEIESSVQKDMLMCVYTCICNLLCLDILNILLNVTMVKGAELYDAWLQTINVKFYNTHLLYEASHPAQEFIWLTKIL